MKHIPLIVILICLFSCKENKQPFKELNINNNPIKILVKKNDQPLILDDDDFKIEVIKLDSNHIVGEITKILTVDNSTFILDTKTNSLFCFDINGKNKWVYSKLGKGPGEHSNLLDFCIRNNMVYLFDQHLKEIKLDFNGNFINQHKINFKDNNLSPTLFFIDKNSDVMAYSSDMGAPETDFPFKIAILDSTLSTIKSAYLKKTNPVGVKKWQNRFAIQTFINNKGFFYSEPLNDTIYTYTGDSVFNRKYFVDFGIYKAPNSYLRKTKYGLDDFWKSKYAGDISSMFETDSILTFQTMIAGRPYYHFYDKKKHSVSNFRIIMLKCDIFEFIVQFIGGAGDRLYFKLEPYSILQAFNFYRENKFNALSTNEYVNMIKNKSPLLYNLINGTTIYSNSILLSIDLSSNKILKNDTVLSSN